MPALRLRSVCGGTSPAGGPFQSPGFAGDHGHQLGSGAVRPAVGDLLPTCVFCKERGGFCRRAPFCAPCVPDRPESRHVQICDRPVRRGRLLHDDGGFQYDHYPAAGKRIAIAALCAGMTFSMAGCASPFANNKGGDKSGTEDLAGMMEGPEEVYVTTGEVAPPEDTGEEGGQEGSTEKDNTSGQDSTGKDNTSGQDSTGKEDISGHGSTSGTEDPEEYQLMGDVVYSVEEDLAL